MINRNWASFLAAKAIAVSVVAMGAGYVLAQVALPKLADALHGVGRMPSDLVLTGLRFKAELPFLPAPGLLLGLAAFMFPSVRRPCAVLAMVAAAVSTLIIVGLLIGSLAPLYQVPRELGY
jgi:hypothetical protein